MLLTLVLSALVVACTEPAPAPPATPDRVDAGSCDDPGVRVVVERLGEQMSDVPLLAPDSVVVRALREAYAPLVTPSLLAAWTADPARAPGREVSSPWPERIEVRSVEPVGDGGCRVEGEVVYLTSVELAQGGAAAREPITLRVVTDGDWRVSAYEAVLPAGAEPEPETEPSSEPTDSAATSAVAAAEVVQRYYEAIAARDFRRAYALWGNGGAASGQSFEAFAAGFAETTHVEADVGAPGRIEPAAGSRYVEVPVTVRAVARGGEAQRFEGTYTLRRAVVPGATAEQRRWHLYTADIERIH